MRSVAAQFVLAVLGLLCGHRAAAQCQFTVVDQRFTALLASQSLPGGALLIGTRDGLLHEAYFGNYGPNTVVPLASATKLLSAVRIAQLAERGVLALDAPVSATLPQFTGLKGTMTPRQMFSHTAGYGADETSPLLGTSVPSLAAAVDLVACCVPFPNGWSPGSQFAYGGISMHVAGRMAEVATGVDWELGWKRSIGGPLGITTIDWQGLGPTLNYRIAGGARSSLRDYGRVLQMLVADGVGNGRPVLTPAALDMLFTDYVGSLPIASAPANAPTPVLYGLGNWIEPTSTNLAEPTASSLGAFGFFPWLDRQRALYGVFMILGSGGINDAARPAYLLMMQDTQAIVDGGACPLIERVDPIFIDSIEDLN